MLLPCTGSLSEETKDNFRCIELYNNVIIHVLHFCCSDFILPLYDVDINKTNFFQAQFDAGELITQREVVSTVS